MSENDALTTKIDQTEASRQLRSSQPDVDIVENENEILLLADLPGVAKENLTIHIKNGKLMLSGTRKMEHSGAANWEEFASTEFKRNFSVPQSIEVTKVNAELRDGVLTLHLPKSSAAKPKTIQIN